MSKDKKIKVIYFNFDNKNYEVGLLSELTASETPICTAKHFINTVCKFFEDVTPKMKDNPMYQKADWASLDI